jgi:uncharacterized protein
MGLIIRSSAIHAAGCFTTAPIARRKHIIEYTGPLLDINVANAMYEDKDYTFLFQSPFKRKFIDGHGMAAFINHSCDPNCETDFIGKGVWIIALRDIAAGEELSYDYNLFDGALDDPAPCHCGAKSCRGTMYSEEEIERLKKLAAEEKQKKRKRSR